MNAIMWSPVELWRQNYLYVEFEAIYVSGLLEIDWEESVYNDKHYKDGNNAKG